MRVVGFELVDEDGKGEILLEMDGSNLLLSATTMRQVDQA